MISLLEAIRNNDNVNPHEPGFPHAPAGWTRADAIRTAQQEGLKLNEVHWEVVRALQEFFARHADSNTIHTRELHDALDEKFHIKGGRKFLFSLFPGGPVAQGCRIAGLKAPVGASDAGFGSVM